MIAYIEGRLVEVMECAAIIVTGGGMGYEVFLGSHTLSKLPSIGENVHFSICTIVREDALELFGFESWDERKIFLLLISISRVGARTAMAILSLFRPDDLRRLVAEDDVSSLTRVPGIGKKTGQQIFLELKYKLKGEIPVIAGRPQKKEDRVFADAVMGLRNLGYDEEEASETVKLVLSAENDLDMGGILRSALKILAGSRS